MTDNLKSRDASASNNLVQFEEDFNSRTKKLRSGRVGLLSQTRSIPRSPDGDNKEIVTEISEIQSQPENVDGNPDRQHRVSSKAGSVRDIYILG